MNRTPASPATHVAPAVRSWRVTTAVRAFALALATGQVLSADTITTDVLPLTALFVIATVCCVLDLGVSGRATLWIPVVEGMLAAVVLASGIKVTPPLMIYLAVPLVVAGIRRGSVTTLNTFLATGSTLAVAWYGAEVLGLEATFASAAVPWLSVGLGAGLLAGWQTRSLRVLEAAQAPYAAAHQLMSQLHTLTKAGTVGLDPVSSATALVNEVRDRTGAIRAALYVYGESGRLDRLVSSGNIDGYDDLAGSFPATPPWGWSLADLALPLTVGDHTAGLLVLGRHGAWPHEAREVARRSADELALRLETTLLFDEVRASATVEERHRLAREIHDGVAQEIVGLGYLVDEIESTTAEPGTLSTAEALRNEITRVVSELRFSIFDLRHEVAEQNLSGALAEYVREISAGSDLRVHLLLDEQGPPLPRRVESELLRIAQEALGNVRKHARANNVWVSLVTDGHTLRLSVEDDGVGAVAPKDRHYGLHTMRERAERIGAELLIIPRPDRGTAVTVTSRPPQSSEEPHAHEHHSPARR
ncbi:ATPase [Nocardioides gansuensis]|uniref:ATPase n=1 Tax=Nocardioides gansuensis TaxID=2138300 RepID=A0A2T8FAK3_9ACTN|nr:sensor histidine kinase [Nocardioides gansuensis]PVG82746.1 ATPase [Nocardioides gansuensis]